MVKEHAQSSFSVHSRSENLRKMSQLELDVLVIGGGITGAGVAWDAARRGMKIGLLEMNDFGSGTSSRSTKLVHGGLRYLKQGEVKLVMEVGRERALLHRHAPHIVIPAPMLLPIYEGGTFGYWASSVGLYVYDLLAGVKRSERRIMHNRTRTTELEPLFKKEGLKGSGYYYEYRTDDARLTVEILKTASRHGALAANYAKVESFIYKGGKAVGARVLDQLTGDYVEIYAKKIINAAGPWVDKVRESDNSLKGKRLLLTKGVHLVVDSSKLPVKQAAYFDVPGGRMIFVIPRGSKTYFGTTDTVYEGDIHDPRTSEEDLMYLIHAVNNMFPNVRLKPEDIESSWAGLRPLVYEEGKGPSEISRKDEVFISDSGLLTIAGGKLTGFRKMAEKIVNLAASLIKEEGGKQFGPCSTDQEVISGGDRGGFETFSKHAEYLIAKASQAGIPRQRTEYLLGLYGSNTIHIIEAFGTMKEESDVELRLLRAELSYVVNREMAAKAIDFIERRSAQLFFDLPRANRIAASVVAEMGSMLGWNEEEREKQLAEVQLAIKKATTFPKEGRSS